MSVGDQEENETEQSAEDDEIQTTQEEIDGFNIVRAICAQEVDPSRVVMRDAKSYCAVLLDDNNRKTIARLHFNSPRTRYLGLFKGKVEERVSVVAPVDIYNHAQRLRARVKELES